MLAEESAVFYAAWQWARQSERQLWGPEAYCREEWGRWLEVEAAQLAVPSVGAQGGERGGGEEPGCAPAVAGAGTDSLQIR